MRLKRFNHRAMLASKLGRSAPLCDVSSQVGHPGNPELDTPCLGGRERSPGTGADLVALELCHDRVHLDHDFVRARNVGCDKVAPRFKQAGYEVNVTR